ncbi:hypothetical protein Ahy_A06g026331 isoform C [Arachis hypogaea]|uniref:Uncharacterized protein n=1 Tax=Arachis hypogaea TaxID=3818 RepID=A0A445CK61_ARAHY|nr:hypothetical protein Ahy_A06g026331 isoform C [Arachis hypogaea]
MASRDAHVPYAVRRVHDHTPGRGIPAGFASRRPLRERVLVRVPYIHRGWPSSLGLVPRVARSYTVNSELSRSYSVTVKHLAVFKLASMHFTKC